MGLAKKITNLPAITTPDPVDLFIVQHLAGTAGQRTRSIALTDLLALVQLPTLASVATSGAYGDLSGKPSLGTAAAHDASDFLTNGSTGTFAGVNIAGGSLQLTSDGTVTGAISASDGSFSLAGTVTALSFNGNTVTAGSGTLTLNGFTIAAAGSGTVALLSDITSLWNDRGSHDASGNTYPTSGGSGAAGAILKGNIWTIAGPGTLGGTAVKNGDTARAIVDTPGQTAGNWALAEHDLGYTPANDLLGNLSNASTARTNLGLGTAAVVNLGTNVAGALAINVGSAGAVVVLNGALGTPSSGNLASCTGLLIPGGGTGATSAAGALANLGGMPQAGGAFAGFITEPARFCLTANQTASGTLAATPVALGTFAAVLAPSSRYRITLMCPFSCVGSIGVKYGFAASGGLTTTSYTGLGYDLFDIVGGSILSGTFSSMTATNAFFGQTNNGSCGFVEVFIQTNAGGTLTAQFSSAANSNTAVAKAGTNMIVQQVP